MENLANQVQTFVRNQTADDGQDGGVGLLPQAHHPLQGSLVLRLAAHVLHGVPGGDPLVGGWIVEVHVDAVEHAGQLIVALAHDVLQPVGEVGHFQLVGVGGGYGVDGVGAENGALQQVHVPVHDNGAVIGPALIQTEQVAQGLHAVATLVLDVVDAQSGLDGAETVLPHAVVLQIDGHQGGLPVVAVDDLRPELQVAQHPHNGPGEKAEALAIIHVAIQIGPVEILLVVQEVPGDTVPLQGKQAAVAVPPGQVHKVIALEAQLIAELLFHLLVQGQDHRHLGALGGQSRRERACHVRQSAGFTEGNSLAGRIQNLHKVLLFITNSIS